MAEPSYSIFFSFILFGFPSKNSFSVNNNSLIFHSLWPVLLSQFPSPDSPPLLFSSWTGKHHQGKHITRQTESMTKEWIPATMGLRKIQTSSGSYHCHSPDFHSPRAFFHSNYSHMSFLFHKMS